VSDSTSGVIATPDVKAAAGFADAYLEANRLRPVDKLAAAYNALLAVIWAMLIPQALSSIWVSLAHTAAAAMPWLLRHAPQRLSAPARVLREIYPLVWILPWWTELDSVRRLLHDANFDRVVGDLDLLLFGTHLDQVFLPRLHALWFSELMYAAYFAYYLTVIIPLLYALIRGTTEMKRDMTYRVVLVYLACFFVYIAFPIDGPHWLTEHFQGPHQQGFFYKVEQFLQSRGSALGCSFPSSHVAASTTMALLGFRWLSRTSAWLLTLGALGVVVSTVYTQNHYAIDSLAGIIWAFWIYFAVGPKLLRCWQREVGAPSGA
jgi:membrane-associated phospholipid phosphatase